MPWFEVLSRNFPELNEEKHEITQILYLVYRGQDLNPQPLKFKAGVTIIYLRTYKLLLNVQQFCAKEVRNCMRYVLPDKLIVAHLIKKYLRFMDPERPLPYSQGSAIDLCSQTNLVLISLPCFSQYCSNIISVSTIQCSKWTPTLSFSDEVSTCTPHLSVQCYTTHT